MARFAVGNNSPSSSSGYSGGSSRSDRSSDSSRSERSSPTYVTKSLTLPEAIRAVLGGTLDINLFLVQLPQGLQIFLDDTARAAFGSTSFTTLDQNDRKHLLKELLGTIELLEQESRAREQEAARALFPTPLKTEDSIPSLFRPKAVPDDFGLMRGSKNVALAPVSGIATAKEERQKEDRLRQQRAAETTAREETLARQRRLVQEAAKRKITEEERMHPKSRASRNAARRQRRLDAKKARKGHGSHPSAGLLPRVVPFKLWLITTIIALLSITTLIVLWIIG